jgi:hypothetical protein
VWSQPTVGGQLAVLHLFGERQCVLETFPTTQPLGKVSQRSYKPERLIVIEAYEIALT